MEERGSWFVGIDWATERHQVCLEDKEGHVVGERSVEHSGSGLAELCSWLVERTGAQPSEIWVAIEVPHGAVVHTLLEKGLVVHSINPKQMDRFRDRFTTAGAKDDRRDARVLADSLRTDRHCFRRLEVDEPLVIELREWSRIAEDLQNERTRLTNRLREQLRRYYPQAIDLTDDVGANWFLDLWEYLPTPAKAARGREKSVARILKTHRIRKLDATRALEILRQVPLSVAPGTTEAATAHIRTLLARVRLINQQLKDAQRRLDELLSDLGSHDSSGENSQGHKREQRDVEILRSLPGVGRITLATLLAEASQPLRARDYHALRSLSGAAPVTRSSGKQRVVLMRHACNYRLREALYHWGRTATQHDPATRQAYAELRSRGHSHGRALRSVCDRLLAVACAMLREGSPYDPARRHHRREPKAA